MQEIIIRDPAEPQPDPAQFADLMQNFFDACKDPNTKATYWIIELQIKHRNGTSEDVVAIGENKGAGGDHVEEVFTKWWPSYKKKLDEEGSTCKSLKVYTNYTPCPRCATALSEWLSDNRDITMSIFYAFVYEQSRFGTGDEYKEGWEKLHNADNFFDMKDLSTSSLGELAIRIKYQRTANEDISIAENWRKQCKEEVNYPKNDPQA